MFFDSLAYISPFPNKHPLLRFLLFPSFTLHHAHTRQAGLFFLLSPLKTAATAAAAAAAAADFDLYLVIVYRFGSTDTHRQISHPHHGMDGLH